MGMRIYNGWKFPEGTNFEQAFLGARGLQPSMDALADKELEMRITELAAVRIDRWLAGTMGWIEYPFDMAEGRSPIVDAFSAVAERRQLVRDKGIRAADVDVEASMVVIPHATGLYAMTYCENENLRRALCQGMGLEEFCWYDDEAPEGLSEEQWAGRKETWDSLLGDRAIPSLVGATIQLVLEKHITPCPSIGSVLDLSSIAPLAKRAHSLAVDAPESGLHEARTMGNAYRAIASLNENPPKEFVELRQRIQDTLPDPIPQDWFFMKKPELLATWQAMALAGETAKPDGRRSGPRL